FVPDDRDELREGDKILLIIEDDLKFAKIAQDFAHRKKFKCLVAGDGRTGLKLVDTYQPDAIILDLHLPGIGGWEVLDILKQNPATRHIPVHIMSVEDETLDAYKKGAIGYLTKPVSPKNLELAVDKIEGLVAREIKSLLLVEDDVTLRQSVKKLLSSSDVKISEVSKGETSLELLRFQHFDCMIL
ncbi:MAG: response regulator, partial [bacterium]|nr:response regulator [bacterium]